MKTKLPNFKPKTRQIEILLLLYRFRFLNRNQIQQMLNHRQFNRVIVWLNQLSEQKYLYRVFDRKFAGVPALYFLRSKAKKELEGKEGVKNKLLERVYGEKYLSKTFQKHCQLLADIYLSLVKLTKAHKAKLSFYTKNDLYGLKYLILPNPDAYFSIKESDEKIKRYFLDIFDATSSNKWYAKRVMQYFSYYAKGYWQDHNANPFPEIIFVYPNETAKKILIKTIKRELEKEETLCFYLASWEDIRQNGLIRQSLSKATTA